MVGPVSRFARRRIRHTLVVLGVGMIALLLYLVGNLHLWRTRDLSGWMLAAVLAVPLLHHLRNRFPAWLLGNANKWLQFHIYAGWLALFLFFLHLAGHWPRGLNDGLLAVLFLLLSLSGLAGVVIQSWIPPRLAQQAEVVEVKTISHRRRNLEQQVLALLAEVHEHTGSPTLEIYYRQHLADFFADHRDVLSHLIESRTRRVARFRHLDTLNHILGEEDIPYLQRLRKLVYEKMDLDRQWAFQIPLYTWRRFHDPIVYALWLMLLNHIVLVYLFREGTG